VATRQLLLLLLLLLLGALGLRQALGMEGQVCGGGWHSALCKA
jgi:hypothetical protein